MSKADKTSELITVTRQMNLTLGDVPSDAKTVKLV
jgi:hypothetical protein